MIKINEHTVKVTNMSDSILPSQGPHTRPTSSTQRLFSRTRHYMVEQSYISESEIIMKQQLGRAHKEIVELQRQLKGAKKTIASQAQMNQNLTSPKKNSFVPCPVRADNGAHRGWW